MKLFIDTNVELNAIIFGGGESFVIFFNIKFTV